ncbi:MAG TPA: NAD(P)H-dependent oxidoreductase [Polyangiaceae bacterium]|jgi:NAD(P)H-dependent FMN reductase
MLNLKVVLTSTRPGRVNLPIGNWFLAEALAHGHFAVELVDLAELALPLLDEAKHPRFAQYEHEHTKRWSAIVSAADAFVFVIPEYNHGMPPALLNALDYLFHEWAYKPAAFVNYGGVSAGTRSVQMTKPVLTALKMMPIPESVSIPFFQPMVEAGVFTPPESTQKSAVALLNELERWAAALKPLRAGK